jgi:hypothetical protein
MLGPAVFIFLAPTARKARAIAYHEIMKECRHDNKPMSSAANMPDDFS